MPFKSAEQELAEFLAPLPIGVQKWLRGEFRMSDDERSSLFTVDTGRLRDEYEAILQRIPTEYREYRRKLQREEAGLLAPPGKPGRPRDDDRRKLARELHDAGKSHSAMAKALSREDPSRPIKPDAARKLLSPSKARTSDKT